MPREKMSSCRTIVSSAVAKDRIITQFPPPYHQDATPYKTLSFHPKVKAACAENRTGRVGLKICKAVIVGDVAVGKTCLVNRFCHDVFNRDYKATIGVDFEVEKFSVLSIPFTLQVWDTAGQERFKCIAASYYRGANIVIVAFDLTEEGSLLNSDAAYTEVETRAMVVANNLGAEFWPTSSKSGYNVQDFFFRVVTLVFDANLQKELESSAAPAKQIGTGLIQVQRENSQYFEKKRKAQCCK
ncbi:hypothetical protein BaRGS_00027228 [Batillaria attramentaria]|uniref:Ras-related protein Rab-34 n=1 Tax=Batillaria attramentaria TaxID=370345 RepID=A0ABD0K2V3_9CAEN